MKPRLRLVVDNTGRRLFTQSPPPSEPLWSRDNIDYVVNRALYDLRDLRISHAEKERLLRKYLAEEA
jgi:hypothetical protein